MDLVRVAGLLRPNQGESDLPVSLSAAFALHELDQGAELSQQELADRLLLEKSTVSRLVSDLERRGLLARDRDPANRRVYRLRLTAAGRQFRDRMSADRAERYRAWTDAMTPQERSALLSGLPALIRVIRESGDPAP